MPDQRKQPAVYMPPGPEPMADGIRYVLCTVCGQVVDMRDLGQVDHHNGEAHAPLEQRPDRSGL